MTVRVVLSLARSHPAPHASRPVVLVVDPDPAVRGHFYDVLVPEGFLVRTTHSAARAAALASQHQACHLLITEMFPPGVSGLELGAVFQHTYPETVVVYMSEDPRFSADQHDVLAKPLDPAVTLELARTATAASRERPRSPSVVHDALIRRWDAAVDRIEHLRRRGQYRAARQLAERTMGEAAQARDRHAPGSLSRQACVLHWLRVRSLPGLAEHSIHPPA